MVEKLTKLKNDLINQVIKMDPDIERSYAFKLNIDGAANPYAKLLNDLQNEPSQTKEHFWLFIYVFYYLISSILTPSSSLGNKFREFDICDQNSQQNPPEY